MFYKISTTQPLSLLDKLQLGELTPKAAATFVEFQGLKDLKIKVLPQYLEYLESLGDVLLIKDKEGQRIPFEKALNNQAGFCPESHYWVVSDEWGELPLTSLFIEWWKISDRTTRRRFLKQVGVRFYPQLFISRIGQNYWQDYVELLQRKNLFLLIGLLIADGLIVRLPLLLGLQPLNSPLNSILLILIPLTFLDPIMTRLTAVWLGIARPYIPENARTKPLTDEEKSLVRRTLAEVVESLSIQEVILVLLSIKRSKNLFKVNPNKLIPLLKLRLTFFTYPVLELEKKGSFLRELWDSVAVILITKLNCTSLSESYELAQQIDSHHLKQLSQVRWFYDEQNPSFEVLSANQKLQRFLLRCSKKSLITDN